MTATSSPPLHVLRGILRHLKKTLPPSSTPTNDLTLREHILSQYRASRDLPPEKSSALRAMAYDYYVLKTDLAERARLHELDAGADVKLSPKELSRRAAARAGLQLPKLDEWT
ncbi:hypothetical protein HJC23_006653 [Cyclotella cryptica]|uniref:Complex 1 LYR protein n=1 Tax=Cyclotella cryptica TaxID=29204 RepID=A0ABD3R0N0_9STRA|eukprot:CCRYP_001092-RA/>CCRYP_001092-RA protein AED:0.02 eAED:-0.02 QI:0/-1/0/1/-1/1/1/0/112